MYHVFAYIVAPTLTFLLNRMDLGMDTSSVGSRRKWRCGLPVLAALLLVGGLGAPLAKAQSDSLRFEEDGRFAAPEANQAVAVDEEYVYAIDNYAIGKYEKLTGEKVDEWHGAENRQIGHLNSGVVIDDTLYCAHSNFPDVPMMSSIEMWDVETMTHVGSHSFGIYEGSATWVDRHDGSWWVVFAHYAGEGGVAGKGPEWTRLIRFDDDWRPTGGWGFPEAVIDRFRPYSNSGGAWGPAGRLYVTGHDAAEVYLLERPRAGATLRLVDTLDFPGQGQGIAWSPSRPNVLYGIRRADRTVVWARLRKVDGP